MKTVEDIEDEAEEVRDHFAPEFAAEFSGATPMRHFLDSASFLPLRNVTLLSGDGGTGKTLLAMQLAIATATTTGWLGFDILDPGTVLFLSAEDDRDEVHIRLHDICEAEGLRLGDLDRLAFLHCAGRDVVLATEEKGRVRLTENFGRLRKACEKVRPKLLVLDPAANLFAVNENSRPSALACINSLRSLALDFDMAVLLLTHPSLSGLNSGSGTSGSTGWNNAVRSRLYFTSKRPSNGKNADDEEESDPDARYLTPKKANYTKLGETIPLRWENGRFVRADEERPFDGVNVQHLEKVRAAFRHGEWRYDERAGDWGGYLVAEIIDVDIGKGKLVRDLTKMEKAGRRKVRSIISAWMRSDQISIDERKDGRTGRDTKFFKAG